MLGYGGGVFCHNVFSNGQMACFLLLNLAVPVATDTNFLLAVIHVMNMI